MSHFGHGEGVRCLVTVAAATCIFLALQGCQEQQGPEQLREAISAVQDGSSRRILQAHFDQHPQCAPVLSTDGASDRLVAIPGDKAATALSTAGLIEAAAPDPVLRGIDRVMQYRISPSHRQAFVRDIWGGKKVWLLCFGKRSVGSVTLDVEGPQTRLRYEFSIKDEPRWMHNPAMRSTFPGVVDAYSGLYSSEESLPLNRGKPDLGQAMPMADHPLVLRGAAFVIR